MSTVARRAGHELSRVLIVNTSDRGGGAERSVMALADAFEAHGTRVQVAVGRKQSGDPRVIELHASDHIDYRPYARHQHRARQAALRRIDAALGLEDFRYPFSGRLLELGGAAPDLVLANNLHGGFFDLRVLGWLSRQVPVVLRLSDSWTFTGHCACTGGCERWLEGCGHCPDLTLAPAISRDATWINWQRKRRIFDAAPQIALIAPSQWMLDRARRSLLGGEREATVIHSGVDLATFGPGPQAAARARVGLAAQPRVLLFVANGGSANRFKDFATVRTAFRMLAGERAEQELALVVVGGERRASEAVGERAAIHEIPYTDSREAMAEWYRAADLYVHSAPEDTLPLTLLEALACGLPVTATDVGGTTECVDDGVNGFLVPTGAPREMASALGRMLDDAALRQAMAGAARDVACRRFDARVQLARIHTWCAQFAERSRTRSQDVAAIASAIAPTTPDSSPSAGSAT